MGYIKVKDHSDLVRDSRSNAILNINNEMYNAKMLRKKKIKERNQDIDNLKKDVAEIKSLLKELINNTKS